jgi:hypothetical protein
MPVPQDATVTFRLGGLLVFCFDKRRNHCHVGIHSNTDDHELRLRFVKKGPGLVSESEQRLTISHALLRRAPDLWLDVEGDPSPEQRIAEPFIIGSLDDPPTDPNDFRRVIDLEGEHFYNRPLRVRRDVLRPILVFAKGLFYTATLKSDLYMTVPVAPEGTTAAIAAGRSLGLIAEYVGANVYLANAQALVLRWGRNGPEILRLRKEEGTTYEIWVENVDAKGATPGTHFSHYYEAFEIRPDEPRILIDVHGLPKMGGGLGSPCELIRLSKSDGLASEGY